MKSMMPSGVCSMVSAIEVMNMSDVVACTADHVDVIESIQETVTRDDNVKPGSEGRRVDVIESIGSEGLGRIYVLCRSGVDDCPTIESTA